MNNFQFSPFVFKQTWWPYTRFTLNNNCIKRPSSNIQIQWATMLYGIDTFINYPEIAVSWLDFSETCWFFCCVNYRSLFSSSTILKFWTVSCVSVFSVIIAHSGNRIRSIYNVIRATTGCVLTTCYLKSKLKHYEYFILCTPYNWVVRVWLLCVYKWVETTPSNFSNLLKWFIFYSDLYRAMFLHCLFIPNSENSIVLSNYVLHKNFIKLRKVVF